MPKSQSRPSPMLSGGEPEMTMARPEDLQPAGNAAMIDAMKAAAPAAPAGALAAPVSAGESPVGTRPAERAPPQRSPADTVAGTVNAANKVRGIGMLAANPTPMGAVLAGAGLLKTVWDAGKHIQENAPYVTRDRGGVSYGVAHDNAGVRARTGQPEPVAAAPEPGVSEPVALVEPSVDLSRARAFGRVQQALEERRMADAEHLAAVFLQRYPTGSLSAEAGVLQIEAVATHDPAAAVRLADAWLGSHRNLDQRHDVLLLRATAARDGLQDCALALPSYEELARLASGAQEARALAFLGLCAADVGDSGRAATALDAALIHPDLPRALAPRVRTARARLHEDPQ